MLQTPTWILINTPDFARNSFPFGHSIIQFYHT